MKSNEVRCRVSLVTSNKVLTRNHKIANSLGMHGYHVTIYNWDKTGEKPIFEKKTTYEIVNISIKTRSKKDWIIAFYYPIWWMILFFYLLKDEAEILQSENVYNFIPLIPIKIIKRKKVVFDVADSFAYSYNWSKFLFKFFSLFEKICMTFADGVIIVDEFRLHEIAFFGKKIYYTIVMNCAEDTVFNNSKKYLNDKFTLYVGGLLIKRKGITEICNAMQDCPNAQLLIAGSGQMTDYVIAISKRQPNIQYLGLLSYERSLELTYESDCVVALYDPVIPLNRVASPNKVFDALMCGTPIIANREAIPIAKLIEKEKCGYLVDYNNIDELSMLIRTIGDKTDELKAMSERCRLAFVNKYNWRIMEKRLLEFYENLSLNKRV